MYLTTQSFNIHFINVFIGLFSGHPFLIPQSRKIHALGYNFLQLEPKFEYICDENNKTINPDAICSNTDNIIFLECTSEQNISPKKRNQIHKYLHQGAFQAIAKACVNTDISDSNVRLWIVVRPEAKDSFNHFINNVINNIDQEKIILSLFSYEEKIGFVLNHDIGQFMDKDFNTILNSRIIFKRIPEGYISIPLDDYKNIKFTDGIIQEIVSLVSRDKSKFTTLDLCYGMFPIWNYFSDNKKHEIERQVKDYIRGLCNSYNINEWFVYTPPGIIEIYESFSSAKFKNFLKRLQEMS
jgi:hypothetical protein